MRIGYGWGLVAALSATSAIAGDGELHTYHCWQGCPVGAPATNDTVVREIYTLSSNDLTKFADWVAYRVTKDSIGPSQGREWEADPWLAPDETLTPNAYDGANDRLHIDRGHQAPLASFSGTPFADETNILSNITPQSSALNQGPWVKLEDQERALAQRLGVPVYVTTGPLYERYMQPLPNGGDWQRVPSGYWKVVALTDGRISAFIFDQATQRRADYCDGRVPLHFVELRSRLRLFPQATTVFTSLDAELGCTTAVPALPSPADIPAEAKPTPAPKRRAGS